MAGLPKIALARLKANPKSFGPSSGPDAFQGAEHPDANLLAALVERTLTEHERTQVLNHLSQCAECREVAAFTLPTEAAVAEPTRAGAGRRWTPWPVLHWGAMAAVLGALTVVVVLHPGMWKGHPEISKVTPPPAPAGNSTSAPQAVSVSPLAPLPPETAQAKAHEEAQKSAGEMAAIEKASGPHQDLTRYDHAARTQAKQRVTLMASTRPPATFRAENVPAVKAEGEESKEGNALTARVLPAPPPSAAPAAVSAAVSNAVAKAGAESQAGPAALRATTQSVEVAGANTGAGLAEGAPAKATPRLPAQATLRMSAPTPMGEVQAFRKERELGAGQPAALWSVSSDGKVQRSTDAGKTFEQVQFAHRIKFRAIAALGNEVWAGGTGGALFHSVDGGESWNRADINFEGNVVTETIAGIQMRDPQHLTVTTASGSQWVSEDGGQHWRKKP
jgi:hypothetical protein